MSIKTLAKAVLQGNHRGNIKETEVSQTGNFVETGHSMSFLSKPQKNASDFVRFCLAHQNTFPSGHCPVKNHKPDPLTNCVGWQIKQGKVSIH